MADTAHLDIFFQGVDAWNNWRLKNPDILPDLSEVDLSGQVLQHANFQGVNFKQSVLEFSDFTGSNFSNATLDDAFLSEADLTAANLFSASFVDADLSFANLHAADCFNAVFSNANMDNAELERTLFYQTNLSGASLVGAFLHRTVFQESSLQGVTMANTVVTHSIFKKAQLDCIDLRHSTFDNCDFEKANLKRALFRNAQFIETNLKHCKMVKSKGGANSFTGSNLQWIDFSAASLIGCDFKNALLSEAKFDGANTTDSNFAKAKLGHSTFDKAEACNCKFFQSELINCRFDNADLSTSDLRAANMSHASFQHTDITDILFDTNSMPFRKSCQLAQLTHAIKRKKGLTHRALRRYPLFNISLPRKEQLRYPLREINIKLHKWTKWNGLTVDSKEDIITAKYRGIRVDDSHGSQLFKRTATDQSYIEECMATGKWWSSLAHKIWYYTSDYGQSMTLWAFWSLVVAVMFGIIFYMLGADSFHASYLNNEKTSDPGFWALLYYSVVTFTTLGFGDIVPKTGPAAFVVTLEVIWGYIMLGGLIAIFANKLARRGE